MFFVKLTLFKIKRMLRFLPGVLAGALALCFIMGIFAYGANHLIYKETAVVKQQIGVVRPENDKYIDLALGMVKNVESVDALCEFSYIDDEQTALKMLEEGKLNGVVVLPYRFIQDIVHGKNTPARVFLPKNSELYGKLFKDLADNGIGMLADVQAAVQAGFFAVEGKDNHILEAKTDDFNMMYFEIFLPREKLFREKSVSASGNLTVSEYYGVMAVSVLCLLVGICLAFITGGESEALKSLLKRNGVGKYVLFIVDNITLIFFYFIIFVLIYVGFYFAGIELRFNFSAIALSIVLVAALVSGIYNIFQSWSGALVLFVIVVISAFVGGAVLPQAFLPEVVARFTPYSPVYILFALMQNTLTDGFTFSLWFTYGVMLAIIYGLVFFVQLFRRR